MPRNGQGLVYHVCTSANSVCVCVLYRLYVKMYSAVYVFDELWRRVAACGVVASMQCVHV